MYSKTCILLSIYDNPSQYDLSQIWWMTNPITTTFITISMNPPANEFDVEVGRIRNNDVFGEYGLDLFVSGMLMGISRCSR